MPIPCVLDRIILLFLPFGKKRYIILRMLLKYMKNIPDRYDSNIEYLSTYIIFARVFHSRGRSPSVDVYLDYGLCI